jgi:hypothetical protein
MSLRPKSKPPPTPPTFAATKRRSPRPK